MGGNLAWTLRKADGQEYRMDRWTNSIPTLIVNPGFLDGREEAIDEALKSWSDMKDDWEKNQSTGDYALPMTDVYAPYPFGLKPSEYGIVITCFQTNRILSCQDYTDLAHCSPVGFSLGKERAREVFPGRIERIEEMLEANRVSAYSFICMNSDLLKDLKNLPGIQIEDCGNHQEIVVPSETSYEDLAEIISRHQPNFGSSSIMYEKVVADLSPFVLEEFRPDAEGVRALKERVKELGFSLDPDEEKAWLDWIAQKERDD